MFILLASHLSTVSHFFFDCLFREALSLFYFLVFIFYFLYFVFLFLFFIFVFCFCILFLISFGCDIKYIDIILLILIIGIIKGVGAAAAEAGKKQVQLLFYHHCHLLILFVGFELNFYDKTSTLLIKLIYTFTTILIFNLFKFYYNYFSIFLRLTSPSNQLIIYHPSLYLY